MNGTDTYEVVSSLVHLLGPFVDVCVAGAGFAPGTRRTGAAGQPLPGMDLRTGMQ